jgi:phosphoribosylformimino-5-aminoimidazole carboxamide ribotide isomerase
MLLIPSIDLRGGRCVRLLQGDFAAETRYEITPQELLARYRRYGASWVHVVDLDGARDGALANRASVLALAVAEPSVALQVGGGIRSAATIEDLLEHGVSRAVIGSAAIEAPDDVRGWFEHFGAEKLCLAFDVRLDADGIPRVRTRGWTRATSVSLWDAVAGYLGHGLRHVLCTDIGRDGVLGGPSVALYRQAAQRFPQVAFQASGGIATGADLAALATTGVAAAISGKALIEERLSPEELQPYLPSALSPA